MDETSFDAELQSFFQKSSLDDWKKIATKETGGEEILETLSWHSADQISFRPYYDATTETELRFVRSFASQKPRQWLNLPVVEIQNVSEANRLALDHLMQGADGLVFDVRGQQVDANRLLNGLEWPHCYLGFLIDGNRSFLASLQEMIGKHSWSENISGTLFWERPPVGTDLTFFLQMPVPFRALGLLVAESSPAEELSNALLQGVRAVEAFGAEAVFRSVAFSLPVNAVLLENVAKFKALRILWYQVARVYGFDDYQSHELFVHARSQRVADGGFGPHENMIKATYASMGALMGGCNALTVEGDGETSFAARCARNVSTILREEAFFDRQPDPLMGAWAIDAITHAIAGKAWELFQHKWKSA